MGLFDGIKQIISRENCERSIKYDTRKLEFKLGAEYSGLEISLADFKTEVQKIRDASEYAELLDNYQYQMCRVSRSLKKDDIDWKKYNKIRIGSLQILTSLQATLIAFKSDPKGQKPRLDKIVGDLQDYFLIVTREIMPNVEEIESEKYITKGSLTSIPQTTITKALDIAGLNEEQVNSLIENIEE